MPNTYFQFKQFTVHQDKCAMKVCTDACLFGAYAAEKIRQLNIRTILDIGTGTGLLSLLLAQKTTANIDAVEIDEPAYFQAKSNFEKSPWKEQLTVSHSSIEDFNSFTHKRYDVIISNPPFFENQLRSDTKEINLARHDEGMTLDTLFEVVKNKLTDDGHFFLLIPFYRTVYAEELAAANHLSVLNKLSARQTPDHDLFRSILVLSKKNNREVIAEEVTIRSAKNSYSVEFAELLKDYYLHL